MAGKRLSLLVRSAVGLAVVGLLLRGAPRQASAASIIYVNAAAGGANNGTSWKDAYTDLQAAITAAVSGDQIWVAQGLYLPTTTADRDATFHLKDGVAIYGGFIGKETQLDPRNPYAHRSVLSGDIGVFGDQSDNSYHVVDSSHTDNTAILDGFAIEAGNANGDPLCDLCTTDTGRSLGAGIFNVAGAPMLSRLIIRDNWALFAGGGMYSKYNDPGSPTLREVDFIRNHTSGSGGGLAMFDSSPRLNNVIFSTNVAQDTGGGMGAWGDSSSPVLIDVTFAGNWANGGGALSLTTGSTLRISGGTFNNNTAVYDGGAVLFYDAAAEEIINATFNANTSGRFGGAITNRLSNPVLRNITVSGNTATAGAGGMYSDSSSAPLVEDSIFWGDGAEVVNDGSGPAFTDSIVQGGCPANGACTNVVDADPVLGKLKYNGGPTETMSPGLGSAAIDTGGVNAACAADDQRGMARPQGVACDIGAYEVGVMLFYSVGTYDGSVLESGAGTGVGGTVDSTSQVFNLGDNGANQQFRGFLSFDTSTLPNGVKVVLGKVRILKSDQVGADPFSTQGQLRVDLSKPFFGTSLALASADFQASAVVGAAGFVGKVPSLGWYTGSLTNAGSTAINQSGTTQLRLRFTTATNGNNASDYLSLYSGDAPSGKKPYLLVYYNP